MYKYYTADYIFPISTPPIKNGFLLMMNDTVVGVSRTPIETEAPLQKQSGFIVPGFINAHCHLELSYLKDQIKPGTGLVNFVKSILAIRANYSLTAIKQSIQAGYNEMYENGIVAVADISNDDFSFEVKADKRIYFHTLLEAFDIIPTNTESVFEKCLLLTEDLKKIAADNAAHSIVPHAAYTVTPALFRLIYGYATKHNQLQSMHNQECLAESEMFENKSGDFYTLFSQNSAFTHFESTGKNSLISVLDFLSSEKTLLVHNTFTSATDIKLATAKHKNLYWCFCPNANLYIENRLPDFDIFIESGVTCCLGTDSYASNYSLNILDEIKAILKYKPDYTLHMLLTWATLNGAKYLGLNHMGSLACGQKPGVNLITHCDAEKISITSCSKIKRLH
jgi:cytosine/adenosine deaminase-related metal-dependent hydrolase